MKKLILFLVLTISCFAVKAQVFYSSYIDFEHSNSLIKIDTSQPNNIWQIGRPSKVIFDSAHSQPNAIVTDTLHYYPANNTSSFQIDVVPSPGPCWGIGFLTFNHKYDTRPNKDGGYVEIKYEGDTNWTNIIFDTDPQLGTSQYNVYTPTDTISGGIPASNGSSNGWHQVNFQWIWFLGAKSYLHDTLSIRFTFKSDSLQSNKEGWMIDDISISIDYCTGGIESYESSKLISAVVPNPVCSDSYIEIQNYHNQPFDIVIYNEMGTKIQETDNVVQNKYLIRNSDFRNGLYFYQILNDGKELSKGKFVVED